MLAGIAAGVAESITVVTPGENIKTKMIQARQTVQQGPSAGQVIQSIIRQDGILGLYRGVSPVALKQGLNALIRFTSYTTILEAIGPYLQSVGLSAWAPAVAGATAGIITVYGTMPADVVKTKLQSQDTGGVNRGLRICLGDIVRESGVSGFWKGTTPRLARLSVRQTFRHRKPEVLNLMTIQNWQISGAVSFSIYTKVIQFVQNASPQLATQAI